jgi:hypothetical protein
MKFKSLRILILLAPLLGSCSNDTMPKYVVLGGLRILAIRADLGSQFNGTAEFSPGDSVVVTPYVSYYGVTNAVSYLATGCIDPGVNYGATPSCTDVPGATSLGAGAITLTGGVSNTGQGNSFNVAIPATMLVGRSSTDQYNGINYLVVYTLTAVDGSKVSSFKRLPVSIASKAKNQNPVLSNLTANGTALTSMPAGDANVGANYSPASRETFSQMRSDGSLTSSVEDLTTTYFITDGSLKFFRTINEQTSVYTPPSPVPTDHSPLIVGVVRDPRGGVAVKTQAL